MALAKVSGFFTNVGRIGHRPIPRCAKISIDFFLACWIPAIFTQRNLDQPNSYLAMKLGKVAIFALSDSTHLLL